VRSIVDLGHNLLLRVVGEGVESEEVLGELRDCGCDLAQGFLLGRPVPISELRSFSRPEATVAHGVSAPA
jgi:EAL domain-containing protein (putative c-di-GMP-specific phosphodiesterase class I)